jgi:hypothetical protein
LLVLDYSARNISRVALPIYYGIKAKYFYLIDGISREEKTRYTKV